MIYIFTLILIIITFSFGYDYFYHNAFNKGLIFSPSHQKQILMKFVLSASLKFFHIIKFLLIILSLMVIAGTLLFQIKISILWWATLFLNIFNGMFFTGYQYPKMKRIIYWDYKNPVQKWDEIYKSYNQSSKIMLIVCSINFTICLFAFVNGLIKFD
ncbi:MAG: hypothetical protein N3F03_03135 [Ignavibacteria bacterium]|nr:hypothetical protein [Ignavibacteria bacterium]